MSASFKDTMYTGGPFVPGDYLPHAAPVVVTPLSIYTDKLKQYSAKELSISEQLTEIAKRKSALDREYKSLEVDKDAVSEAIGCLKQLIALE